MTSDSPVKAAAELISAYCLKGPGELNLESIAYAEDLYIKETDSRNYYGRLVHNGRAGIITISRGISEPGTRRFTIAHEMGHFFLERNAAGVVKAENNFNCFEDDVRGVKTSMVREDRANIFAAELLMYKPWFTEYINNRAIGTELIKDTASYFNVSVSACAIRLTETGHIPTSAVMSQDGKVVWHCASPDFRLRYIPKGYAVQKHTAAYDYFFKREVNKEAKLILASVWYGSNCPRDLYLYEQSIFMRNYNSVLTLLWEWGEE